MDALQVIQILLVFKLETFTAVSNLDTFNVSDVKLVWYNTGNKTIAS